MEFNFTLKRLLELTLEGMLHRGMLSSSQRYSGWSIDLDFRTRCVKLTKMD